MTTKDDIGRLGEDRAAEYLTALGYDVIERNWRHAGPQLRGELDILASEGATLVAVEVKTRRSTRFGPAVEAVTPLKVARLRRLLGAWLASHPERDWDRVRLDVIAVQLSAHQPESITHLKAVG